MENLQKTDHQKAKKPHTNSDANRKKDHGAAGHPKKKTEQLECSLESRHLNTRVGNTSHQEWGNRTESHGALKRTIRGPKGHPAEHQ